MKSNHTFVIPAYKESKFLEQCILSLKNQTIKTNILITTSTPNKFIYSLAKKYHIKVIVNTGKKGIGYDFDFAKNHAETDLVTIAHQDDIYDEYYVETILNAYNKQMNSIIIFSDYYEIKKNGEVFNNLNLKIKKILLFLLRFHFWSNTRFIKRSALRFGDAICCPAVTFVNDKVPLDLFSCDLKCNIDWYAWEKLSKVRGYFYYIHKPLMGHRIYEDSTTSEVLKDNGRTIEDYKILCKFWPKTIAKIISKIYSTSEKNNSK